MGYITRYPGHPEEPYAQYDLTVDQVPDDDVDKPRHGFKIESPPSKLQGALSMPPLALGCATYSDIYGSDPSAGPGLYLRMTRLALRYGINAFDTAPHYHPSEILLGKALYALRDEFPRDSYSIITKCGKFSPMKRDHVLDTDLTRACVQRSLNRFKTDYLDVVYIHDAEFNSDINPPDGDPTKALEDPPREDGHKSAYDHGYAVACGLDKENIGKVRGPGDEKILQCVKDLRQLKSEGKIKRIGICSGYFDLLFFFANASMMIHRLTRRLTPIPLV